MPQVAEAQPRAERPPGEQPGAVGPVRWLGGAGGMHGGLRYPTRWRRPYAEGCVRMAPKTLATLMRTRVRPFTACWHERRESRTRGLLAAPAFLPNTWRPTPVSPGCQGGALAPSSEPGDDGSLFSPAPSPWPTQRVRAPPCPPPPGAPRLTRSPDTTFLRQMRV